MRAELRELDSAARLSHQRGYVIVVRKGTDRIFEIERVEEHRFVYRLGGRLLEDVGETLEALERALEIIFCEAFDRANAKTIEYQTFTAMDVEVGV